MISNKAGFCIYLLSIFIVSFIYQPVAGGDLGRYFKMLDIMKYLPFTSMNGYATDPELFVTNFIFWIIAKSGIYHLLPAISTTTVYGVGYYLISDYLVRIKDRNPFGLMLVLQFMQLPLIPIIENVRNIWAFSIIILAIYREIIQKRKNLFTYVMYIVPCFMHSSAFVLVLFRIILPLVGKLVFVLPLVLIFIRQFINFLFVHQDKLPSLFASAISKGYTYLWNNTSNEWLSYVNTSSFFKVQKIMEMSFTLVFILMFFIIRKQLTRDSALFSDFLYLVLLSVIACNIFEAPHYWRYYAASMLMIPVFILSVKFTKNRMAFYILKYFYVLASLFMFMLNTWNTYSTYS